MTDKQTIIYLDHAATTPVRPEVLSAMEPYWAEIYGNPSSMHLGGQRAQRALEDARERIAVALGAWPEEIVFTSGGTESNNLAIKGAVVGQSGKVILTSPIEHSSVLGPCSYLESRGIVKVAKLPVDTQGLIELTAFQQALTSEIALVTVMLVNNETGVRQPIEAMAAMAKEQGVLLHCDAVQAVGKMPLHLHSLGVDMLSLSGHKLYGPKGIGALYLRKGLMLPPLLHGGHQERDYRSGTENVPAIVGLAEALTLATTEMPTELLRIRSLAQQLQEGILLTIPDAVIHGHPTQRIPHILNVGFANVGAEALAIHLDLSGIAISIGSACSSGAVEPSHVLQAMKVAPQFIRGSVRFSLGRPNRPAEIERVLEILPGVIARLRSMAPGNQ